MNISTMPQERLSGLKGPSAAQDPGASLDTLTDQVVLARAADLARAGRYAEAEGLLLDRLGRAHTRRAAAGVQDLLARICAQQGRLTKAEAHWKQALQLAPSNRSFAAGLKRIAQLRRRPAWWAVGRPILIALVLIGLLLPLVWLSSNHLSQRGLLLATSVEKALSEDQELGALDLTVRQVGSVINLAGAVPTFELKARAERLGSGVAGVEAVDATGLVIVPLPLGEMVESALTTDPRLAGSDIVVDQVNNSVRLTGTVTSIEAKDVAAELAGGVAGVELVDSRGLLIVPSPTDDVVRDVLQEDVRTAGLEIEVEQVDPSIRLRGPVSDDEGKDAVESVARGVQGVERLDATAVQVEPLAVDYAVRSGDSLVSIAWHFYGDEALWPLIFDANRDKLDDPDLIFPGTLLVIPAVH